MKADVVVVGAGPAGSSVAKYASQKGLSVIVLEKKRTLGRPSPCAGYVSNLFSRYFRIDPAVIQQPIEKMVTYLPSGQTQTADMKGLIVDRPALDASLCQQAMDEGAEFISGATFTGLLMEDGRVTGAEYKHDNVTFTVSSPLIIGTDGPVSKVAKQAGLPRNDPSTFAICPQHEMTGVDLDDPTKTHTYFSTAFAPGAYAWIYPTGPDSAKVGLGVMKTMQERAPMAYLDRFIASVPMLEDARVVTSLCAPLALGGPVTRTYGAGILLAGDAAGMCDPVSGAGILSAVIAGKMAAETVTEALEVGDTSASALAVYEAQWKKVLGTRLERSRRKRRELEDACTDDATMERAVPCTWITYPGFWRS